MNMSEIKDKNPIFFRLNEFFSKGILLIYKRNKINFYISKVF